MSQAIGSLESLPSILPRFERAALHAHPCALNFTRDHGVPTPSPSHPRITESLANRRRTSDRLGRLEARIARDPRTRADAFRLRHLCYHSKGYIDSRPSRQFSDEYDSVADNTTVVLYKEEQAVGSVRVCAMAPHARRKKIRHLPVAHVFPTDVQALLKDRSKAVEINRLVCHPDHDHSPGLVFMLMRMADYVIRQQDPDFVTSCVRSNHVSFYKRLKFEQLAGPKLYTGLKFMTTFMAARRETFDQVRKTVPMLQMSRATLSSYDRLWTGSSVPVFEDS